MTIEGWFLACLAAWAVTHAAAKLDRNRRLPAIVSLVWLTGAIGATALGLCLAIRLLVNL